MVRSRPARLAARPWRCAPADPYLTANASAGLPRHITDDARTPAVQVGMWGLAKETAMRTTLRDIAIEEIAEATESTPAEEATS